MQAEGHSFQASTSRESKLEWTIHINPQFMSPGSNLIILTIRFAESANPHGSALEGRLQMSKALRMWTHASP